MTNCVCVYVSSFLDEHILFPLIARRETPHRLVASSFVVVLLLLCVYTMAFSCYLPLLLLSFSWKWTTPHRPPSRGTCTSRWRRDNERFTFNIPFSTFVCFIHFSKAKRRSCCVCCRVTLYSVHLPFFFPSLSNTQWRWVRMLKSPHRRRRRRRRRRSM